MSLTNDYQILNKIYESSHSLVYRGILNQNQQPVILKVLKQEYPSISELTRYKQEYEITRSLTTIKGVVKTYGLHKYKNSLVMFLEDFGGESLEILMKSQKLTLPEFLYLAIKICEILTEIHGANIIHKDINPSNIVFNPQTKQLKIIDFGISTTFTRENPTFKNPNILEGTLAYISPEQTGRMNRYLDYRSDFYSLGVTFYQMLTDQLPFETNDALELVHCHIAQQPILPNHLKPEIPEALSDIVMKLLAKKAEERYKSALGIKTDIQECLTQLETTGKISNFSLARQDISEQLQIPQKLYGREPEIKILLTAFERVTGKRLESENTKDSQEQGNIPVAKKQSEMMLVAGYSGIGKSVLVQEIYKPITQTRGYFISGKFDQFQRNIPYSAVVAAFRSLIQQLLTESETELILWREKLLTAFGVNGQVIIDVIPEIEQIVGSQPPIQELEATETQNRFNLVFQNFIRVFCERDCPLVIFLDDLQWADSASLKLMELMITNKQIYYLLLIGAYRDNEVNSNHPLTLSLNHLHEAGAVVNQITLKSLQLEDLSELIADTLQSTKAAVNPLAQLVASKTFGNPFFVNQFLGTIYQENLLTFNRQQGYWQWNLTKIDEILAITDNVVDLMLSQMKKLPESTQVVLQLAACVGNSFELNTLSVIYEKSVAESFNNFLPAIQIGLVKPTSGLEMTSNELIESSLVVIDYKFLHDRVQQAAYSLIDDSQKNSLHLKIGKLLLENSTPEEIENRIFTLVDHLNKGRDLLQESGERVELVKLNLKAGKRAKEAIAYGSAKDYLQIALEELPETIWSNEYTLALDLYKELAEVEYLNGNFDESQYFINLALEKAKTVIECTDFYYLLILQFTLIGKYYDAIEAGIRALKMLGLDLPKQDLKLAFESEVTAFNKNLGNREISSLYAIPEMEIPEKKAALKLLTKMLAAAWIWNSELMYVIAVKLININIQYGHTEKSSIGYSIFAVVNSHVLHNYQRSYEFGLLGLRLSEKFNDLYAKTSAIQMHANMAIPWVMDIKNSEKLNHQGIDVGFQSGELQFVGYILSYNFINLIFQGKNLSYLMQEALRILDFSYETQNQVIIDAALAYQIWLSNLLGKTRGYFNFDIENTTELQYLDICKSHQTFG
ncbi:MAG: serine/threonine-protein kinase PknK, partial [Okeania sp. SIO1H6]|nr:serine/threonine-protein kinase PknK [Okeania sp. SIO1H6]